MTFTGQSPVGQFTSDEAIKLHAWNGEHTSQRHS